MSRNKISISIAGNEFVVMTDEERDYTLELAKTVDSKVRALLQSNGRLSVATAAILCALDLCDENEKNKQACVRLREEIRRYLNQLETVTAEQGQDETRKRLQQLELENEWLRGRLRLYETELTDQNL